MSGAPCRPGATNAPCAVALLGALALLGAATPAAAQGTDELGPYARGAGVDYRSSKDMLIELRFGAYRPDVDSEFTNGQKPYETIFGDDTRFEIALEYDWQVLSIPYLGTLGPGLGIGYTTANADAPFTADPSKRSAEETSLSLVPMYLVAVLRIDVFAREWSIPIVPYAKGGIGWAWWWSSGAGTDASLPAPRGTSYGYQYAFGGMFLLDVLNEHSAAELDYQTSINHSYVFGEWYVSKLDGAGVFSDNLHVGTDTWMLGLAFEF